MSGLPWPLRVSVVIPLFDQGRHLRRALDSVLAQTVVAEEIIVVDDGSTDGGPRAAIELDRPQIRVIRQPHSGVSAARNAGVGKAAAAWVAFLDADDEWAPRFLERTTSLAAREPGLVAVFSNLDASAHPRGMLLDMPAYATVLDDYFVALARNRGLGMSASSVIVKREALLACGGFPEGVSIGEDLDTWARLAWSGQVGYVPGCLATYHSDADGRATVLARDRVPVFPAYLASYERWLAEGRVPAHLRSSSRGLANRVLANHVVELAHAGRGVEARSLLRRHAFGGAPRLAYLKACVWTALPPRLLKALRRARLSFSGSAAGQRRAEA